MMHGLAISLPESNLLQSALRQRACAHMHIECGQALTHGSRPPEASSWAVMQVGTVSARLRVILSSICLRVTGSCLRLGFPSVGEARMTRCPMARCPEAGGVAKHSAATWQLQLNSGSPAQWASRFKNLGAAAFNGRSKKSQAHKCSQHDPMPRLISARRRTFARPGLLSLTPLEHRSTTWRFMRDSPSWVFVFRTCDNPTAHCKGRAQS